jgi:hypothetical protein
MRRSKTKEDKVAEKITNLLNDVTLDLEEVGKVIANGQMTLSYNRLVLIAESAVEEKERTYERQFDTLF